MRNVSHTRQESPSFSRGEEVKAGTFLISGFDPESGEDTSLTEEQFDHWDKRFHSPEILVQNANNELLAVPVPIK